LRIHRRVDMHKRPRIPVLFGTSDRFTSPDEVWTVSDALRPRRTAALVVRDPWRVEGS
jgi:hypothetical protein